MIGQTGTAVVAREILKPLAVNDGRTYGVVEGQLGARS